MKWYKRFSASLLSALERSGRARALSVLGSMDPRFLREAGLSPELMQLGIKAWPWRAEAIDPPEVTPMSAGSSEVAANTDQMVGGSPAKIRLRRVESSDASALPGRIDDEVAA